MLSLQTSECSEESTDQGNINHSSCQLRLLHVQTSTVHVCVPSYSSEPALWQGGEPGEAEAGGTPPGHLYWAGHPSQLLCLWLVMAPTASSSGKLPLVNGNCFTQEVTCPSSGSWQAMTDWHRGTKSPVSLHQSGTYSGVQCLLRSPLGEQVVVRLWLTAHLS